MSEQVIVTCVYGRDCCLGALKLCLAELDDGAQSELVSGLREGQSSCGLCSELICDTDAPKCGCGVECSYTDIAGDAVRKLLRLLLSSMLTQPCFLSLGGDTKSGEDRKRQVNAAGRIPIGHENSIRTYWRDSADRQSGDCGQILQLLRPGNSLICLSAQAGSLEVRPL